MRHAHTYLMLVVGYGVIALCIVFSLGSKVNSVYSNSSPVFEVRRVFVDSIHLASPALATAGRNIAFESGNSVANAPASYLTQLDCCESDEAIADRIAIGKARARILKKDKRN